MKQVIRQLDKAILSSVSVLFFLILQFIWVVVKAETLVPVWVISLVIMLSYLVCILTYALVKKTSGPVNYKLPEVKSVVIYEGKLILLVEKNDLFLYDSLVAIYYQGHDDVLERFLGIGYVESVHQSGSMQIVFAKFDETNFAKSTVHNLNDRVRKSIKIKPTIPREYLEV